MERGVVVVVVGCTRNTGCPAKNAFYSRIFIILPPLPRKHWAAIGCTEIGQSIGVTSDCSLALR